jgi:ABC-2 type transport system ATP-binding protein
MGKSTADGPVLEVEGIWKSFAGKAVVRDVSFRVEPGHVLGVVGPNGAGKTTSIRIALGIIQPDRGRVEVLGSPLTQEARERIGYLPEERGLYDKRPVLGTLTYLGELKGLSHKQAVKRAQELLEQVGLADHTHKKSSELSHGMGQLAQLVATVMHHPDLIVLDEPFTALDPVNVRKLKDLVGELRDRGTALVLCTHQMNQVEELCDDVVMINNGTVALSGEVAKIRRKHRGNVLKVTSNPPPDGLRGIKDVEKDRDGFRLRMVRGTKPEDVLAQLMEQGASIERFEVAMPSMEDIFVQVAGRPVDGEGNTAKQRKRR